MWHSALADVALCVADVAFCARRCGIVRRRCVAFARRCDGFSALVRRFFGARATVFRRSCDVICDKVFSDPKVFSDRPFLL
jgi:hypothetical protein